ncbi:hypothetical protein AUEXF2481DRAFT_704194 [Aureobasidium subglaciale EXF-2481]|uniref:Uncharacterized protein n=1 Tax=Aureobasidium subglaciale (strain EXF-2481) TaxID=1043005 RepID=A0A074YUR5_AURSE|nr:uncharacterized protein AUEXF2481DRAFT_704194 [Aureobasidium subglaciale EXF-2481]KEQ90566.1 hypothetical protein AUEXF2481DRAFT_704194 [Aureobasidium subglaciale EXF-2481]
MFDVSFPSFADLKGLPDKWYICMVLIGTLMTYSGRLLFQLFDLCPQDAAAYADISAWFGPGAYLAWWLTAASVLLKRVLKFLAGPDIGTNRDDHWDVGADFLSSTFYVAAVAVWSIVQASRREYAELDAGLIVLEAAADLGLIYVLTTTTKRSSRLAALSFFVFSILVHNAPPIHKVVDPPVKRSSAVPNHRLAVGVSLLVIAIYASVEAFVTFPLEPKVGKILIAFVLGALWIFSNELGTYAIIPHTGARIVSIDQLGPLGGALLVIGWSWGAEVKMGGKWVKGWMKSEH